MRRESRRSEPLCRAARRRADRGRRLRGVRLDAPAVPISHDLERRRRNGGNTALEDSLDIAQQAVFVRRDQRNRLPGRARPARAADAMHVVLRHVGQLVIDHLRQLLDVEAAGRDFGGDQRGHLSALEHVERFDASGLTLVAVDRGGADAGALELLREPVGAVLGARENQHLAPLALLNQVHQQMPLLLLLHPVRALLDELDGGVARGNLNRQRIVQQALGERANIVRIGRGEQQVLPLGAAAA